ncbi:MAG: hypothetical protein RLZZ396_2243, partial [Planctomycetota bacterium]
MFFRLGLPFLVGYRLRKFLLSKPSAIDVPGRTADVVRCR